MFNKYDKVDLFEVCSLPAVVLSLIAFAVVPFEYSWLIVLGVVVLTFIIYSFVLKVRKHRNLEENYSEDPEDIKAYWHAKYSAQFNKK